jgi:hypothetical protein
LQSSHGDHFSWVDFPVLPGKTSKYPSRNRKDIELVFDDVIITMPANVLYYLDNMEALGWEHGWLPEPEIVARILRGGDIRFNPSARDKLTKPNIGCGYLRNTEDSGIVDTGGSDENFYQGKAIPANFGPVNPDVIERVKKLVGAALRVGYDREAGMTLPALQGYEKTNRSFDPLPRGLWDNLGLFFLDRIEASGIDSRPLSWPEMLEAVEKIDPVYTELLGIEFLSMDKDVALLNIEKFFGNEKLARCGMSFDDMHAKLTSVLRDAFGIEVSQDTSPRFVCIVGDDIRKMEKAGVKVVRIDPDNVSLADKVAVLLGASNNGVEIDDEAIVIKGRKGHRMAYHLYGYGALDEWVSIGSGAEFMIEHRGDENIRGKFLEITECNFFSHLFEARMVSLSATSRRRQELARMPTLRTCAT